MKRALLTFVFLSTILLGVQAMGYEEARRQSWFLTDKMAYELNLTPEQYDRVYEINLDYFLSLRSPSDCSGYYWNYRDMDLRYVLFDWQYRAYCALEYFFRPVRWVNAAWYYPVAYRYRAGYYYYDRPTVYVSYSGRNWRRRSHNDRSPYYGMRMEHKRGMRDAYDQGRGRGDHNYGGARPGRGGEGRHPGGSQGQGDQRPGGDRGHNGGGSATPPGGRRPGQGEQRPGQGTRPGGNHGGRSENTTPSRPGGGRSETTGRGQRTPSRERSGASASQRSSRQQGAAGGGSGRNGSNSRSFNRR